MKFIQQTFLVLSLGTGIYAANAAKSQSFPGAEHCIIFAAAGSVTLSGSKKADLEVKGCEKAGVDASSQDVAGENATLLLQKQALEESLTVSVPAGLRVTIFGSDKASVTIKNLVNCNLVAMMANGGNVRISGCSEGRLRFYGYGSGSLFLAKTNNWNYKSIDLCGNIAAEQEVENNTFSLSSGFVTTRGGATLITGTGSIGSGAKAFDDYDNTPYSTEKLAQELQHYVSDLAILRDIKASIKAGPSKDKPIIEYARIFSLHPQLQSFLGKIESYNALLDASCFCVVNAEHALIAQGLAACQTVPRYAREASDAQTVQMVYGVYFFNQKNYAAAAKIWGAVPSDDYSNYEIAEENLWQTVQLLAKDPKTLNEAGAIAAFIRNPENKLKATLLCSNK